MRKRLILRIAALVALLGVIGAFSGGCSVTVIIGWGGDFFRSLCDYIYYENADSLAYRFYANQVWLRPEGASHGQLLTREDIRRTWQSYFDQWYIESCRLDRENVQQTGNTAVAYITRIEVRRPQYSSGPREVVTATEEYQLQRIGGEWQITGWVIVSSSCTYL
jgi:hypothetical protein